MIRIEEVEEIDDVQRMKYRRDDLQFIEGKNESLQCKCFLTTEIQRV